MLINYLLIDKIRFILNRELLIFYLSLNNETIDKYIKRIKNFFYQHFHKSAFRIADKGYKRGLIIEFNPTRYFSNKNIMNICSDVNVQGISELNLLHIFDELGFLDMINEYPSIFGNVTKLHLTKNFIVEESVKEYTSVIAQRNCNRFKVTEFETYGISIATQKRKKEKDATTMKRQAVLYDKTLEIITEKSLEEIVLKYPLTNEEKMLIPKECITQKYSHDCLINLSKLKMLRIELQYNNNAMMKPLARVVGQTNDDSLKIASLLDLLNQDKLYETLNNYYINQLKNMVFSINPNDETEISKLTQYDRLFMDLYQETESNIKELQALFNDCGRDKATKRAITKIIPYLKNPLYDELYNMVITS